MREPKFFKRPKGLMTRIVAVVILVGLGVCLFVVSEDLAVKIATPLAVAFWSFALLSSYFHEKKDDNVFKSISINYDDDSFYKSLKWSSSYKEYKSKNPFKEIKERSMKKDLFKRYRHKGKFAVDLILGLLIGIWIYSISYEDEEILLLEPVILICFLKKALGDISVKTVKTFLNRCGDYDKLEDSYLNGKALAYKSNGLIFGKTHVHIYTKYKIFTIDYRLIDDVTRRVQKNKYYFLGIIYNNVVYDHFAVFHLKSLENGNQVLLDLELNEFQVQMAIEEFVRLKDKSLSALESNKEISSGRTLYDNSYNVVDFEENLRLMKNYYKNRPFQNIKLPRPSWLAKQDALSRLYDDKQTLFDNGEIYYAQIVQANELLFNPSSKIDAPANVIFSSNPIVNKFPYLLKIVAEKLYSYKDANPADVPEYLRKLVEVITNERDRAVVDFTVPLALESETISATEAGRYSNGQPTLVEIDARFISIIVFRKDVPSGVVNGSLFPILAAPNRCESAIILPKEYWSIDFSNWKDFL